MTTTSPLLEALDRAREAVLAGRDGEAQRALLEAAALGWHMNPERARRAAAACVRGAGEGEPQ